MTYCIPVYTLAAAIRGSRGEPIVGVRPKLYLAHYLLLSIQSCLCILTIYVVLPFRLSLANLVPFIQSSHLTDSTYYNFRGIVLSPECALLPTELDILR